MAATLSATMQNAADTAANAAANGSKNAAYLTSISSSIGSGYKVKALRNGTEVLAMTMTGSLSVSSGTITLPTSYASLDTLSNADIDSGTWVLRIEKASDAGVYIEGSLGKAGGDFDFTLTGDLVSGDDVTLGSIVLNPPSYDTVTSPSTNSVQKIYADTIGPNDGYLHRFRGYFNNMGLQDPAAVLMGAYPVGSAFTGWGYWWDNISSVLDEYKDDDFWTHWWAWMVLHEEGTSATDSSTCLNPSSATNIRLGLRRVITNMRRRSTGQWVRVSDVPNPGWFRVSQTNHQWVSGSVDIRTNNTDGGQEILLPPQTGNAFHLVAPNYRMDLSSIVSDIDAVHVAAEIRLVKDNPAGADNRSQAKWMVYIGGDWMPNGYSGVEEDMRPGYALSRLKRVPTDGSWEWINVCNLREMRQDNRDSRHSTPYSSIVANPPSFT